MMIAAAVRLADESGLEAGFSTPSQPSDPDTFAAMFGEYSVKYPNIIEMAMAASYDKSSSIVAGCDDQFEFALDVLLDGGERLRKQGWSSNGPKRISNPSLESIKQSKRRRDPK